MHRGTRGLWSVVLAASLVLAGCGDDDGGGADAAGGSGASDVAPSGEPVIERGDEVRGSFSMVAMAHTTEYAGADVEEGEPNPWSGAPAPGGPYRYAAIPCSENAPVNNISSDLPSFNTMIPGSRVPASTRSHPFEFEVVEDDDGDLRLEGTIEMTVCQLRSGVTPDPDPVPDADKDRIRFEFSADFDEATAESTVWRGTFEIVGGTGPYEELRGQGQIAGSFFCFAPEGCEGLGELRDLQYSLIGTYRVPAEALDAANAGPTTAEGPDTDTGTEPETDSEPGPGTGTGADTDADGS
jgi:predicted small secreted protein